MLLTRDNVLEALRKALAPRAEVLEAYLFGSLARGQAQPHSDVDVAVFLDPEWLSAPLAGAELSADLAAALHTDRLELVVLNEAPPLLYHRVLRDGIRLLTRDPQATTVREGRALSRYCDYLPQLRKIERAHRGRVAGGGFGT